MLQPNSNTGRDRAHIELEGDVVGILDARRSALIGVDDLTVGDFHRVKVIRPLDDRLSISSGESHVIEAGPDRMSWRAAPDAG